MTRHRVALQAGPEEFETRVDEETDLLDAMGQAGLSVRRSCRNGVCGLCKCRLTAGEITYHWREPHGLWEKHRAEGMILPCIAFARSDLVIDRIPLLDSGSV